MFHVTNVCVVVVASHAEGWKIQSQLWLSCTDLYFAQGTRGVLLLRVGGATRQLDLPCLTPLSVAGCGRLQLLVAIGILQ